MGGDFEVLSGVGHVLGNMGAQLGCYLGWAMWGAIWVAAGGLILGGPCREAIWAAIWNVNLGLWLAIWGAMKIIS